jgi:hypothetical protein
MQIRFPLQSTRARVAAFMSLLFLAAFGVSGLATWLALTAPVDEARAMPVPLNRPTTPPV